MRVCDQFWKALSYQLQKLACPVHHYLWSQTCGIPAMGHSLPPPMIWHTALVVPAPLGAILVGQEPVGVLVFYSSFPLLHY